MNLSKGLALAVAVLSSGQGLDAQESSERLLWVNGPAGRLRVSDGGSGGTPVLFVHSLAGNRTQWSGQLAHVRKSRRAVAFDMLGHGESDKPSGAAYSLESVAADIEAIVNELGLERLVLVGHSFGGGAVATYAGAHPNRVAGLFFVDPIGDQRSARTQIDMLVQMLQSPAYQSAAMMYYEAILVNATPDVRGEVLASLNQTSQEALVNAFRSIVEFDPVATLQALSGPMFNVISDLNEFPTSLHNVISDLPTERMTGTSHWPHMDRPEEFNSLLDEFLTGRL
jgi:pimeloyl-ACP methyl ester carboxylesterase